MKSFFLIIFVCFFLLNELSYMYLLLIYFIKLYLINLTNQVKVKLTLYNR